MAISRFKKYRQILQEEAKKIRAGEKSRVFNTSNITASVLFIIAVCIWSYYFTIKPQSSKSEFSDKSKLLKIVFFNLGQGDSTLLITPSKKTILIDAGEKPEYENIIIPYLTKELELRTTDYGLRIIDYFILSHPHADCYGGFVTLIENQIIPEIVYNTDFASPYPAYKTFLETIKNTNAKYIIPALGETVDFGDGISGKFLGPIPPLDKYRVTKSPENNSSIVMKLTYQNVSVLFTGDIELEAENDLGAWRDELKSTVLKVAQHGSKESTSSPFLDRVAPSIAVISAGQENTLGYPDESTLKKLADRNINIVRTDQNGTVTLLTDGKSIKIITER
ncbi:MAG: ComEC/Rec2 family competence protein [Elusimicrobiota bacterium]